MSTITIYYPGLLGPEISLRELHSNDWPEQDQVTALCEMLSCGEVTARDRRDVEAEVLEYLGVEIKSGQELPISHFRTNQNDLQPEQTWCLDPVNIAIDRDEAVMLGNSVLNIDEYEARNLIEELNRHFEVDGLQIHYYTPDKWLLRGDIELQTYSLSRTMYQDINRYQPTGRDERKWRVLINEVQMLLHTHPVNEQRAENGLTTINSLWLWGRGKPDYIYKTDQIVLADYSLVEDVASTTGIPSYPLTAQFLDYIDPTKNLLMVFTNQMHTVWRNDVFGWFEHLKHLNRDYLEPAMKLLRRGTIERLVLDSDTMRITLSAKDLKRHFWQFRKKTGSLESSINRFRNQYGC